MLNQEFGQSSSAFYSLSLVSWQLWMTTTFYFCPKQVRFYPSGHKGSSRFCGLKCVSLAKTLVSLVFRFKMQTWVNYGWASKSRQWANQLSKWCNFLEHLRALCPLPSGSCCPRIWLLFIKTLNFIKGKSSTLDPQSLPKCPEMEESLKCSIFYIRILYLTRPTLTKHHPLL